MSCSHDFKLFVMFLPGRENLFECQNVLLRHDSFALDEQFLTISIAIWRRQCGHESEHASGVAVGLCEGRQSIDRSVSGLFVLAV